MSVELNDRAYVSIEKEVLAGLPAANYNKEIVIVDRNDGIRDAVAELRQSSIIGFDTETKPSFKKGEYHTIALVQLSTPEKSFLFRINKIGLPQEVIDILEDRKLLKVGLSIRDDFHNLAKIAEMNPQSFVELQSYAKEFKITDSSLSRLYGILFGERISKHQRLSNWEAEELTDAQKNYAALDAYACIRIYRYLKEGNFRPADSAYLKYYEETPEISEEES